jgi:hypothetical protein
MEEADRPIEFQLGREKVADPFIEVHPVLACNVALDAHWLSEWFPTLTNPRSSVVLHDINRQCCSERSSHAEHMHMPQFL